MAIFFLFKFFSWRFGNRKLQERLVFHHFWKTDLPTNKNSSPPPPPKSKKLIQISPPHLLTNNIKNSWNFLSVGGRAPYKKGKITSTARQASSIFTRVLALHKVPGQFFKLVKDLRCGHNQDLESALSPKP